MHNACLNIENIESSILLELLHSYKDGLSIPNKLGFLPLHLAVATSSAVEGGNDIYSKKQQMIMKLINMILHAYPTAISYCNNEMQLPIHIALTKPKFISISILELLLSNFPEATQHIDLYGHLPLHKVCQITKKDRINIQILEILLELYPEGARIKDKRG